MTDIITEAKWIARLPSPKRARAIRVAAGFPQEALADQLGVHRVTLARWETGERRPRHAMAAKYSRLLDELARASITAGDAA